MNRWNHGATDSPLYTQGFTRFWQYKIMIPVIHNFLTICPTTLRLSVSLDHSSVYIVPKWELSACVTFMFCSRFPKVWGQSHRFTQADTTFCNKHIRGKRTLNINKLVIYKIQEATLHTKYVEGNSLWQ